jgi:hypothetical protein
MQGTRGVPRRGLPSMLVVVRERAGRRERGASCPGGSRAATLHAARRGFIEVQKAPQGGASSYCLHGDSPFGNRPG